MYLVIVSDSHETHVHSFATEDEANRFAETEKAEADEYTRSVVRAYVTEAWDNPKYKHATGGYGGASVQPSDDTPDLPPGELRDRLDNW